MTEIERYKVALQVAISGLRQLGLDYSNHTDRVERAIDAILNPPVEMEDVPVVRWECVHCGMTFKDEDPLFDQTKGCGKCGGRGNVWGKLTGTLTRSKPVPVEKSVSVQALLQKSGEAIPIKDDREYPFHEALGTFRPDTVGTLTFTWTE